MSDKEIGVLVLEVRDELVKRGYVLTPTYKKVKGDWRVKITVTQGGSSVQKKVLETALQMAGWVKKLQPISLQTRKHSRSWD